MKGKVKSISQQEFFATEKFGEPYKRELAVRSVTEYNELGNIIKSDKDHLRFGRYITKYIYDNKGCLIEMNQYYPDGSLVWKTMYEYDNKKNKIQEKNYKPDGSLSSEMPIKYDKAGNRVEESLFSPLEGVMYKLLTTYNKQGDIIEQNEFNMDGSRSRRTVFRYNKNSNPVEIVEYNAKGTQRSKQTFQYDEKQNETYHKAFYSDGHQTLYKKRYSGIDKKGNWTTVINFSNNSPTRIVDRIITYY